MRSFLVYFGATYIAYRTSKSPPFFFFLCIFSSSVSFSYMVARSYLMYELILFSGCSLHIGHHYRSPGGTPQHACGHRETCRAPLLAAARGHTSSTLFQPAADFHLRNSRFRHPKATRELQRVLVHICLSINHSFSLDGLLADLLHCIFSLASCYSSCKLPDNKWSCYPCLSLLAQDLRHLFR